MSEKTGLREDLRSEIETLVASDGPDDEVLNEVVRRIHEARPSWDWSGIYLLVGGRPRARSPHGTGGSLAHRDR